MTGFHELRVFKVRPDKEGRLTPLLPDNWKPFSTRYVEEMWGPGYYEVVCRKWHRQGKTLLDMQNEIDAAKA